MLSIQWMKMKLRHASKKKAVLQSIEVIISSINAGIPFEIISQEICPTIKEIDELLQLVDAERIKGMTQLEILNYFNVVKRCKRWVAEIFIRSFCYSIVLLMLGYALLIYFVYSFAPQVLTMLDLNNPQTIIINHIARVLFMFLTLLIMFGVIAITVLKQDDLKIALYIRFHQHPFLKLGRMIYSHHFALSFNILLEVNPSSQTTITMMRNINDPFLSWGAYHIEETLEKGQTVYEVFNETFFSEYFRLFTKQGLLNDNLSTSLDSFLSISKIMIEKKVLGCGRVLKTLVYLFIIILVFMYYNYLFLPLKLMEQIL